MEVATLFERAAQVLPGGSLVFSERCYSYFEIGQVKCAPVEEADYQKLSASSRLFVRRRTGGEIQTYIEQTGEDRQKARLVKEEKRRIAPPDSLYFRPRRTTPVL